MERNQRIVESDPLAGIGPQITPVEPDEVETKDVQKPAERKDVQKPAERKDVSGPE